MESTPLPEFITLRHEDLHKDFKNVAPPRRKTNATLAQLRDERRCHKCGLVGSGKLQVCSRCKFTPYCSKKCQSVDWPEHKPKCSSQVVADSSRGEHPDLAIKFATRVPACQLLIYLLQTYAISVRPDIFTSNTHMLRITVSTQPADLMAWLASQMASGENASNLEVMLRFEKLESVPLSLTPAMLVELVEAKAAARRYWIIPLFFTNGVNDFFHPTILMESALSAATKREPLTYRTALTGDNEIPFSQEALRQAMNNFVLMDKKNQFKLRAIPK